MAFHVKEEEILRDILKDSKLLPPYEADLIKEYSSYTGSSHGIYQDMLPRPKLKMSYLEDLELKSERDELKLRRISETRQKAPQLIFACFAHFSKIINNEHSQKTDDLIIDINDLTKFKIF